MPHILAALTQKTCSESGIQYLREVARASGLACKDALISVVSRKKEMEHHEYATTVPHLMKDPLSDWGRLRFESDIRQLVPDTAQHGEIPGSSKIHSKRPLSSTGEVHLRKVHKRWIGRMEFQDKARVRSSSGRLPSG
jgi:hypothetical protein